MAETQTPPEQEKSRKNHIVTAVTICVFTVLSLPTMFFPFILIPAAFAYPLIVGRPKLLFIPLGVTGAAFLALLFITADVVPFLLILTAILSAFGIVAGLLIKYFNKSSKHAKILAIIVGLVILLTPFLFFVEMFTGIFRYPIVRWQIHTYVATNYADFDLRIGRIDFDFKSNRFSARIYYRNNSDIWFNIRRVNIRELRDGFSDNFWARTLNHALIPLLENEFGDELYSFTSSVSGVQAGQPFNITAVIKSASITVTTESADPETLAAHISRYHEFITQKGFNFAQYIFHFQYENAPPIRRRERVIDISVPPELINDGLPALIEHARNNRNQGSIYFDNDIDFRYASRVDSVPRLD